MLLWIVFGTVALVVCLLLSMKIGVRVVYDAAQLRVWLQLGPAMLQVYPEKNTKSDVDQKWKRAKKDVPDQGTGKMPKRKKAVQMKKYPKLKQQSKIQNKIRNKTPK